MDGIATRTATVIRSLLLHALLLSGCAAHTLPLGNAAAAPAAQAPPPAEAGDTSCAEVNIQVQRNGEKLGDSLTLELELPAQVTRGDSVPMSLLMRNTTARSLELSMGGRNDRGHARFFVLDTEGNVLRDSRYGYAMLAILMTERLAPGGVRRIFWMWDQRSNYLPFPYRDERRDAEALPPGTYCVYASLNVPGDPAAHPTTEMHTIRILSR
jgi:hypothetical protein